MIPDSERELLESITEHDLAVLGEKRIEYGDSWKQRGGVGAFFAFCRKWDRIEGHSNRHNYDIFRACMKIKDGNTRLDEAFLDDIGDLRRFLLLVESEVRMTFDNEHEKLRQGKVYPHDYSI